MEQHTQGLVEFDPIRQFVTYEDNNKVIFEFPRSVNIDYLNAVPTFMNYFKDVEVQTYFDTCFMQPCKITAIKRQAFFIGIIKENPRLLS